MWPRETAGYFLEALWARTRRLSDGTLFTKMAPEIWLPAMQKVCDWAHGDPSRRAGTQLYIGLYNWTKVYEQDFTSEVSWPPCGPPLDRSASLRKYAACIGYVGLSRS